MNERLRLKRNGADGPAMPEESSVINYAVKSALMAVEQGCLIIRSVRISNETQDALESLERARVELDGFIRREG